MDWFYNEGCQNWARMGNCGQVWLRMDKAQGQRELQAKMLEKGLLFNASLATGKARL